MQLSAKRQQPEVTEMPEINPRFPQQEEWADTIEGRVIADYKLDIDYEPEGSDPGNDPDAQKEEKNSNAEYPKWSYLERDNTPMINKPQVVDQIE